jgi:SRSO17 transposase
MAYASRHGHTLIDRRIYLPESWTSDPIRCEQAGIPAEVGFATRSQLADDMITAAFEAGTPARWVTADEAYGNNTQLRARLRRHGLGYVLAISRDHLIPIDGGKTRQRADHAAAGLPDWAWTRRSAGPGSKGPRFYDWAWLADVGTDGDPDTAGAHSLLIRRNNTTGELAFYRCWTPQPASLAQLIRVAGIRWIVEEGFQAAKGQVGLDQHQVRRWQSWHRHATLALAALAILTISAAEDHAQPDTIRLSIAEIRRLINILLPHPVGSITHHLHWSDWRLHHQAQAKRAHYTRRLSLEFQP